MKTVRERFKSSQALLSMLLVQLFSTGMQLLSRVILVQGTFIFALSAYRYIVAAICVAPFALYFERALKPWFGQKLLESSFYTNHDLELSPRKNKYAINSPGRTKNFSLKVWFWIFINALVGMTMAQGPFYYGLRDTSATYSVNFLSLVPICTFVISIICRMEELGLQTWAGKAKSVGASLCVGGALATSLYKGKEFYIGHHSHHAQNSVATHKTNMLRGTIFLVGSCFSYAAWFILQVKLLRAFPFRYWGTMLACVMAAIQSVVIGVCIDSSKAAWRLEWNLQLITIVYSGALNTAATFCLLSWAISIKGPTYPPMFNPLSLIFVALSEALILGEPLKAGTLLGMVLIIMGLYSFLWGKKKETKSLPQSNVAAGEVPTSMVAEPAGAQSTTVVVPRSSPNNGVVLKVESRTDIN